ncbi:FRG domain-containing protein [Ralstonia holmesii]|uniref:FRG domain-containing protein n=1 Tax=Ralstonia TaxID=48736 RepID=UPI00046903B4|nr:FRG domain-containing protein [Ralstonia pickettii]
MRTVPATVLLEISKNYADHRARREDSWYWYKEGETVGALPFTISTLYRGQHTRYTPLLTSIARGLQSNDIGEMFRSPIADQAKIVFRLAQAWRFSRELRRHPIAVHAANLRLDLDEIALAQHYGIPTGYLDLTDDFNVAAFFATCRETENGWAPVDAGEGIVYRVHLDKLDAPFDSYIPLGPQQLPRPSEQSAWVTELSFYPSFEVQPGVEMLQFQHDRHVGQHFLEMYAGGELLFPPDPLAEVAAEILACGEIPIDLVEAALDSFASDPYGILSKDLPALRKEISTLATQVSSDRRLLTDQAIQSLLNDEDWSKKMLGTMKARAVAVRRVTVPQAETDPRPDAAADADPVA